MTTHRGWPGSAIKILARTFLVAASIWVLASDSLAAVPAEYIAETLVRGLDTPWAMDFAPDGRIFVSERPGRIRVIENGKLRPEPRVVIDVASAGEGGLLGLAIDPKYSQTRFIYAAYTYRTGVLGLRNRLVRLREDPATGKGGLDKILIDDVAAVDHAPLQLLALTICEC